jgi:hypothetical protein
MNRVMLSRTRARMQGTNPQLLPDEPCDVVKDPGTHAGNQPSAPAR